MKKFVLKIVGTIFAVCFVLCCININFSAIFDIPNTIHITLNDLDELNEESTFGQYVKSQLSENIFTVGGEKQRSTKLLIKLFGFIPIKAVDAVVEEVKEVYLGGIPLGFSISTDGLIVVGDNRASKSGKNPFKTGDIIKSINGQEVQEASDISKLLEDYSGTAVEIIVLRNGQEKNITCVPQYDDVSGEYKLGLWVRDDAQGIGTLTFVTKDGKFGALGHSICDYETGVEIPVQEGGIYLCNLVGINKANKGHTGEMRCLFSQSKAPEGSILNNTKYGVFGETEDSKNLIDTNLTASVGNRMLVKLGKASIISSISGIREEYQIEIIKTNFQPSSSDKSFVFRVTDKRLINLSGGIVQGMSGSPILQNGKIIGAVTHVFLNDATKGYGVYIDWMLSEVNNK